MRHWHLFHTSSPLPCWLRSSAACLLSLPVPALLRLVATFLGTMPSCLTFHAILPPMWDDSRLLLQFFDAISGRSFLVSFQNHRPGFYSRRLGVFPFQNFTTGVLKPPPRGFQTTDRLSTTPTGVFSNTDLFFSRCFTTSAPIFVPSVGVSVGVFLLPAAFCLRTPTGFFTRLLFLFLHIVRELLPFISL